MTKAFIPYTNDHAASNFKRPRPRPDQPTPAFLPRVRTGMPSSFFRRFGSGFIHARLDAKLCARIATACPASGKGFKGAIILGNIDH